MKIKSLSIYTLILGLVLAPLAAENVSISQIDSSALLLSQEVKLYVSVTDALGKPVSGLEQGMFSLAESADGNRFTPVKITAFRAGVNKSAGINFLLVIDNSSSMYDTMDSRLASDASQMRITYAKNALRAFLAGITNPADTVGLISFNSNYTPLVKQTKKAANIEKYLDGIVRPDSSKNEDYTELYASLTLAAAEIDHMPGRKTIIVLSDGKNDPYTPGTGQLHPVFGDKVFTYAEPITRLQEEGVSCFAINFGGKGDIKLDEIAVATGGMVFNAANQDELASVYQAIRERILEEYRISYLANMQPADKKHVKLNFTRGGIAANEVTRFYFSSTIFGTPLQNLTWLLLIPVLLAALLWFLLTRIKFVKLNREPSLEVLNAGPGTVVTKLVPLDSNKTVIGGSTSANLTISGVPSIHDNHATILYDKKEHAYTIFSDQEITVNNAPTKKRKLEAGDVINVEGATIVFDDEVLKKKK